MSFDSVATFVDALRRYRLLDPEQLEEAARTAKGGFADARALAQELVRRRCLTAYQVNQLYQGKGADLVLAQYIVLDRLGEGGMGQVFKARHQGLGRLVALKVIRKELLSNEGAVKRFHREIQAAAQLKHPNVVLAFDADQATELHFFAMEYVEGIDLARLVKDKGPLPIGVACDYIRQAALGMQHAHEKGLVHRDIKPSNLLVATQDGTVKVLDLGLARFERTEERNVPALTQLGKVVGTVDYIAPEQALNASVVDIRADVYSLGCTFYFILTGKPPFSKGDSLRKLARHRWEEPKAVEKRRPDAPAAVLAVMRKMMAKKPEDRYQTPAEVAEALAPFATQAGQGASDIPIAMPISTSAVAAAQPVGAAALPVAAAVAGAGLPVAAVAALPEAVPFPPPALPATRQSSRSLRLARPKKRRAGLPVLLGVAGLVVGIVCLSVLIARTGPGSDPGRSTEQLPPPERFTNSVGITLVLIQPGTFVMGSSEKEDNRGDDEAAHPVTISKPFYLDTHEVTQGQYEKVMGRNPSAFPGKANCPVETVNWEEANEFCKKLSALEAERKAGRVYRLPTEAEWEYACRARSRTAYTHGDDRGDLAALAWTNLTAGEKPHPVGQLRANAWALYDMHGNVWEWCSDWYDAGYYQRSPSVDPQGPETGTARVCRGGSFDMRPADARSARRSSAEPTQRSNNTGFRVACTIPGRMP